MVCSFKDVFELLQCCVQPGYSLGEKKKLLESAVAWHSTLVKNALTGKEEEKERYQEREREE